MLELSYLVKWVRSDTESPPFLRSHELSTEALEVFRQAAHKEGEVRALISVVQFSSAEVRDELLDEAEAIAAGLNSERLVAAVLAARARSMAVMGHRKEARALHLQALTSFRRTGTWADQARCLFSLSIGDGDSREKRDFAIEAADLYRQNGEFAEASRAMLIAFINAEEVDPLSALEGLAEQGLEDAKAAQHSSQMAHFYKKLALIAASNGRFDEAQGYRTLCAKYEDDDGLSPRERWESNLEMTKTIIAMCQTQGNQEAEKEFQTELERLKAVKPSL